MKSIKRRFHIITARKIRAFNTFQAASDYVDTRLKQKPAHSFNIQQTANQWIVSRVIGA